MNSAPRSVLLIISGSIAAYKSLEIIRLLAARGVAVTAVLTKGGAAFITPLAVSSLTGTKTYTDLFSLTDEVEMGHIELSRSADLILVAPASADIMAKMASGICDDLATTLLLATNKPVWVAPAMNHKMWEHAATKRNVTQLEHDGIHIIAPTKGDMACGEYGVGRLAEPETIVTQILMHKMHPAQLKGKKALVTSGPTHEPIDPVRYIANRSSGKQGHAIAKALADAGAEVTLITGPTSLADIAQVKMVHVVTAVQMMQAVERAIISTPRPIDIAVCAAAVGDWRTTHDSKQKIKKPISGKTPTISLTENPDILQFLSQHKIARPSLVIGFAAETENVVAHATAKRAKKQCDWILANDVSKGQGFDADENRMILIDENKNEVWAHMSKHAIAQQLVARIESHFENSSSSKTPQKTLKKKAQS